MLLTSGMPDMTTSDFSLVGFLSFWMLLVLLWRPFYYICMYLYGVARRDPVISLAYGTLLHSWISALWGLVL